MRFSLISSTEDPKTPRLNQRSCRIPWLSATKSTRSVHNETLAAACCAHPGAGASRQVSSSPAPAPTISSSEGTPCTKWRSSRRRDESIDASGEMPGARDTKFRNLLPQDSEFKLIVPCRNFARTWGRMDSEKNRRANCSAEPSACTTPNVARTWGGMCSEKFGDRQIWGVVSGAATLRGAGRGSGGKTRQTGTPGS